MTTEANGPAPTHAYEFGLLERHITERNSIWSEMGNVRARLKVCTATIGIIRKMIAAEEVNP